MDVLSFNGRANRLQFWLFSFGLAFISALFNLFAGLLLSAVFSGLSPDQRPWVQFFFVAFLTLIFVWPITAVSVQRAHDRGYSGRWYIAFQVLQVTTSLWILTHAVRAVAPESAEVLAADLVSIVVLLWWLFFIVTLGFLPGQKGENRYGRPPGSGVSNYRPPQP
jgi:uncharacterized membrane protein YhaH (DUF805 family)